MNTDKKYVKIQVIAHEYYLKHIQEFKISYETTKDNKIEYTSL